MKEHDKEHILGDESLDDSELEDFGLEDFRLDVLELETDAAGSGAETDVEEEEYGEHEEYDYEDIEDAPVFSGVFHDVLISADDRVRDALERLMNKCWYTDEIVVMNLQTPQNQPLFDGYLRDNIGDDFQVVTISANLMMAAEDLYEQVTAAISDARGQHSGSADTLLQVLNRDAMDEAGSPRELLIQIDNAHELGEGVFDSLMDLVSGHEQMLTPHIVLWGDMAQIDRLQDLFADREAEVSFFDVPAFSQDAIREYLRFSWAESRGERPLPFNDKPVAWIVKESQGIATEVDRLAEFVLAGEGEKKGASAALTVAASGSFMRAFPRKHAVVALLLVVVLLVIYISRGDEQGSTGNSTVISIERPVAGNPVVPASETEADTSLVQGNAVPDEPAAVALSEPVVESAQGRLPETQAETDSPVSQAAEPPASAPAPESPAPEVVAAPRTPVAEAEPASSGDLFSYPDNTLFIQLLGAYDENSAAQYIADNMGFNGTGGQFYQFETRNQGRPWHVVLFGPYTGRGAAEDALDGLPARLRSGSPWIRSMENIRQSAVE